MSHFLPSTWSDRAGILKGDFLINPRWVQRLVRRVGMRSNERLLVVGLSEFNKRTWQRRLLEYPEATMRGCVVRVQCLESLRVVSTLGRRNGRALNRESLGHLRVRSPEMFLLFSSRRRGTDPRSPHRLHDDRTRLKNKRRYGSRSYSRHRRLQGSLGASR